MEWVIVAAIVYVLLAGSVYRLRHPELTETQLLLRTPKWIIWQ